MKWLGFEGTRRACVVGLFAGWLNAACADSSGASTVGGGGSDGGAAASAGAESSGHGGQSSASTAGGAGGAAGGGDPLCSLSPCGGDLLGSWVYQPDCAVPQTTPLGGCDGSTLTTAFHLEGTAAFDGSVATISR